tara:strand:- start:3543 stop:3806 length:264 start_codon:yes stop_codon:yes gene_type:complete
MYEFWELLMLQEWRATIKKLGPGWLSGNGPHGPGEHDLACPPNWFEVHDMDYGCDDSPPWVRCYRVSQPERTNLTGGLTSSPVSAPR